MFLSLDYRSSSTPTRRTKNNYKGNKGMKYVAKKKEKSTKERKGEKKKKPQKQKHKHIDHAFQTSLILTQFIFKT
jgi:hypothetical protein